MSMGYGSITYDDDNDDVVVEDEEEGLEEDRDWMTICKRERGCWPRFKRGGKRVSRVDSSARDGVAAHQ